MGSPAVDREAVRRKGFAEFVRLAWPQIEPAALVWEPHIDLLCTHYEAVLRGEIKDLVCNVPPGTSKSSISSILFPVWAWIVDPTLKFMFTSYDESLTSLFAERSMRLMLEPWFQDRWPELQILKGERASVTMYENTRGGRRISTMMGGRATGKHCDILVVDDPHKPDDLDADPDSVKEVLELAWRRWINTFSKRRANPATFRRICIMQRLHEDDLAGRMLRRPETVHLCLPMLYDPRRHCKTRWGEDWRTEEGQLLAPLRFPMSVVQTDRDEMSPREFAAQHQQEPAPADGIIFDAAWFNSRWKILPSRAAYYMTIDANLKDRKDSDFCVAQVWAVDGTMYYLVDQIHGRWKFADAVKNIESMLQKWRQVRNILIEDKANGTAIIDTLQATVPGVIAINPEGGKLARAEAVEWLLRAGNCVFADARFTEELKEQAKAFPRGSHDDMVDAMTQFLLWVSKKNRHGRRWRDGVRKAIAAARKPGGGGALYRMLGLR